MSGERVVGQGAGEIGSGAAAPTVDWQATLRASLAAFDREAFGLGDRVLAWLLTGDGPGAGPALAGGPGASLLVGALPSSENPGTGPVWAVIGQLPDDVTRRWLALVLAARQPWGGRLPAPPDAPWLPTLVHHLESAFPRGARVPLAHDDLERLLVLEGADPSGLVTVAFSPPPAMAWWVDSDRQVATRMPGWSDAVARHVDLVPPLLEAHRATALTTTVPLLAALDDEVLALLSPTLARWATGSAAGPRKVAAPLLARVTSTATPILRHLATTGTPTQRRLALEKVGDLGAEQDRDWAVRTAAEDRSAAVRNVVRRWEVPGDRHSDTAAGGDTAQDPDPAGPLLVQPVPAPSWAADDPASCRHLVEDLDQLVQQYVLRLEADRAAAVAAGRWAGQPPTVLTDGWRERLVGALLDARPPTERDPWTDRPRLGQRDLHAMLATLVGHPALTPVAALVLLDAHDALLDHNDHLASGAVAVLDDLHTRTGRPGLLEVSVLLDGFGLDGPDLVTDATVRGWGRLLADDWPDERRAPFASRYGDRAARLLGAGTEHRWGLQPDAVARLLRSGPMSRDAREALYDTALGTAATDREVAQDLLDADPERATRIAAALQDGRGEVRAVAARWAGRARVTALAGPMQVAVRAERHEAARSALLDALARLGHSPREALDMAQLHREAAAAAAKPVPGDLAWFPFDTVPTLHWAGGGDEVDPQLVRWLVLRAFRGRSAAPDAVARHLVGDLHPQDRERLGEMVFRAWMGEDLRPIPRSQGEALARSRARNIMQINAHFAQRDGVPDPTAGRTLEQVMARYLPDALRTPVGAATASKGVLALAAACGGRALVEPAVSYVRDWYGQRPAQSRALVVMLAWLDDDLAVQQVLAIASRFRTKSIQQEAQAQVDALAERHGWTLAELGDRTVPSAGLDDEGRLTLDYGSRTFTAVLERDATLGLRGPEGERLSALPAPRRGDDEDLAGDARRQLAAARKQLKPLVALQTSRLYDAFCTGRVWPVQDWRTFVLGHPVVAVLARRLVWVLTPDGGDPVAVRPLEDGTLLAVDDTPAAWPEDGQVSLAHDRLLTDDAVSAWRQHQDDYELVAPFTQLGRAPVPLETLPPDARDVDDREGWLVGSLTLRSQATRLGWLRGPTEDGGWFYSYLKAFPAVGLTARISFSGNQLPETDRVVALERLTVHRGDGAASGAGGGVLLRELPVVLVSELWADLRALADAGTGYDAGWRATTGS